MTAILNSICSQPELVSNNTSEMIRSKSQFREVLLAHLTMTSPHFRLKTRASNGRWEPREVLRYCCEKWSLLIFAFAVYRPQTISVCPIPINHNRFCIIVFLSLLKIWLKAVAAWYEEEQPDLQVPLPVLGNIGGRLRYLSDAHDYPYANPKQFCLMSRILRQELADILCHSNSEWQG